MAMRSPDKWTAQQDSTRTQAHCAAAITNRVRTMVARRLQGAGGRRCELEDSAWTMGSSDRVAPGPMGLSVVIRLGCPRRVRVMVVGTFKPDAWLEI